MVPQVGVTFQVDLDEHALALPPAVTLIGEELLLSRPTVGQSEGRRDGRAGTSTDASRFDAHEGQARAQLGVVELRQPLAGRTAGLDGGEALLRVVAVHLQVLGDQTFQQRTGAMRRAHLGRPGSRPSIEILSRVQTLKAANNAPWLIRPVWSASSPNSKLRSTSTLAHG